jgi:chromosome condensin MukBEF complex kleisin-like MukF subunit
MDALCDVLLDMLCDGNDDASLHQTMLEHGVTEAAGRSTMLAEATMAHARLNAVEKVLQDLQVKHDGLQVKYDDLQVKHADLQFKYVDLVTEHKALLSEQAKDKAAAQGIRAALQNLMYEPFTLERRGFEMHRILYGCG